MVAGKNYNIQTYHASISGVGSNVIIGAAAVAAGTKRYVTFVRIGLNTIKNSAAGGFRVLFCSVSVTTAVHTMASASANQKLSIGVCSNLITASAALQGGAASNRWASLPSQPDTKNPLFSIAAGNWLAVKKGSTVGGTASTCSVFVQYYDQ